MKKILNNEKTIEQSDFTKISKPTIAFSKKKSRTKFQISPLLTATLTAILIGLFLGVLMLNMFTNKENHASTNNPQQAVGQNDEDDMDQTETKPTTLKQMKAFVLQLGVFSGIENVSSWSETYQQEGYSSIHFHRDDQYFLFAGLAETKEKAKEFATTLLSDDIDVYVKEWITNEIEMELTAEESEWFTSFQEQWQTSLQSLERQEGVILNDWNNLIESYPTDSEKITQLVEVIQLLTEANTENDLELQNKILNIWKVYEKVIYG